MSYNQRRHRGITKEMYRECPHCGSKFGDSEMTGRQFSNHVRWCPLSPKQCSGNKTKFSEKLKLAATKRLGALTDFQVTCATCGVTFTVTERKNQFPKRKKYFCSRSCANTRHHSEATKEKIRLKMQTIAVDNSRSRIRTGTERCCVCGQLIPIEKSFKAVTCSTKCAGLKKVLDKYNGNIPEKIAVRLYRTKCAFTFSIKNYPKEFDIDLISKYGWYSPTNKKNNLNGVSRDHMFSVMDGFRNNVDPSIISHPANCKLVKHSDNISKLDKSSITLDELKDRIKNWESKYGGIS